MRKIQPGFHTYGHGYKYPGGKGMLVYPKQHQAGNEQPAAGKKKSFRQSYPLLKMYEMKDSNDAEQYKSYDTRAAFIHVVNGE
jgi:hypothetical protein